MHDSTPSRRWRRVDALFSAALELPPDERDEFLRRSCGSDGGLLQEVRAVLARSGDAERVLGDAAGEFAPSVLEVVSADSSGEPEEALPDDGRIGQWRVLREIGRGGMGTVFLAERADGEWQQRVALKRVKRGMDTDEVLGRFRYERRILASLEHPNVARLYDGGAASDGRPYLVMEYVDGEPITTYCDRARLGVDERLVLFEGVCEAVQYAHRKLVVHRDLKPSNILVTAAGEPKLLDFGIAKLLDPSAEAEAPRTRTGVRVLTPEYASPEQARGETVTTATDVYALGVVLYELLVGRRPGEGLDARTLDPPPPSVAAVRGDASGEQLSPPDERARARSTTPDRLRHRLSGDLDTIVLKALAEEPEQRYGSVGELLDDLRRHRGGLPVLARKPTWRYRADRFVRRHSGAVAAAALITFSLVGGLGVALWQARSAAAERDEARRARAVAEEERDNAAAVADFLERLFAASDPMAPRAERLDTLRVAAFLDRGATRLQSELASSPFVQARMFGVIGRVNRNLGRYDEATPLLESAILLQREAGSESREELAESLTELGNLLMMRGQPADAEGVHREALRIRRELLGDHDPRVATSLSNLAASLQDQGQLQAAGPLYDEALSILRGLASPDSAHLADLLNGRMALAYRMDDHETALPLAREVLSIDRAMLGNDHPRVSRGVNNLAQMLSRTGAHVEAESLYREAVQSLRDQLGEGHPYVALGMANHAAALGRVGRVDEADSVFRDATMRQRRVLGDTHPQFAVLLANHADILREKGNVADARRMYEQSLAINRRSFGERHPNVGMVMARLAALECASGAPAAGSKLYSDALAILTAALPPGHGRVKQAQVEMESCTS